VTCRKRNHKNQNMWRMRDACSTALAAHGTIGLPCVAHVNLGTLGLVGPRAVNEALLDIRGERVKGLIDVDVALGRDFEERNAEFVCERLAPFCADGALLFPVALVTNEDLVNALGGVLLDVGKPCADVCCAELAGGKGGVEANGYGRSVLLKLLSSVTS
jgi:hypothetical protein